MTLKGQRLSSFLYVLGSEFLFLKDEATLSPPLKKTLRRASDLPAAHRATDDVQHSLHVVGKIPCVLLDRPWGSAESSVVQILYHIVGSHHPL